MYILCGEDGQEGQLLFEVPGISQSRRQDKKGRTDEERVMP